MHRRYYGLKAFLLALAAGVAIYSSLSGSRAVNDTISMHYSAATSLETALVEAEGKIGQTVGHLVSHTLCSLTAL